MYAIRSWLVPPHGSGRPCPTLCLRLLEVSNLGPSLSSMASAFQPLPLSNETQREALPSPGPRQLCRSQDQTRAPLQGHCAPPPAGPVHPTPPNPAL